MLKVFRYAEPTHCKYNVGQVGTQPHASLGRPGVIVRVWPARGERLSKIRRGIPSPER